MSFVAAGGLYLEVKLNFFFLLLQSEVVLNKEIVELEFAKYS